MSRGLCLWASLALAWALACGLGCAPSADGSTGSARTRIVFKHQPLWGDPRAFAALLEAFRRAHPEIELVAETVPNASDVAHQFYLSALDGRSDAFDLFAADVIWLPELARAGWIADLSATIPPDEVARDFFPGAVATAVQDGRTVGVPWYVDAGLLYYRKDLVATPPRTYDALVRAARAAGAGQVGGPYGFVWQGKQYEGLTVNFAEAVWGHGGELAEPGSETVRVDSPQALAGLEWLRGLITSGISPPQVLGYSEEEGRRVFQDGRAVFLRNWPYAWAELQAPRSPVRGKVAVAPLPSVDGRPGPSVLGGFALAVNVHVSPARRAAAALLARHLSSTEAELLLARAYARLPARRAVYDDARFAAASPFLAGLRPILEHARSRPATPYYMLLADSLQSELSGAVSGIRSPAVALRRAQEQIDVLVGEAPAPASRAARRP